MEIEDYDEEKVVPGETFALQVKFSKPSSVWISYGKIYAYLYVYDRSTGKSTCYNKDEKWTVSSAVEWLNEAEWGTWDAKSETFSWSITVDKDAPVGKDVRLRVRYRTYDPGLIQLKLRKDNTVYTGDELRTYIKNSGNPYPQENPTQWTLRYAPPLKVVYNEYYFGKYEDELFVDYTLEDVTIQEAGGGGLGVPIWVLGVIGVVIVVIIIAIVVVKMTSREEIPVEPAPGY